MMNREWEDFFGIEEVYNAADTAIDSYSGAKKDAVAALASCINTNGCVNLDALVDRTEKIRQKHVRGTEDNLLKVAHDGRSAALDMTDRGGKKAYKFKIKRIHLHPRSGRRNCSICRKPERNIDQNGPEQLKIFAHIPDPLPYISVRIFQRANPQLLQDSHAGRKEENGNVH